MKFPFHEAFCILAINFWMNMSFCSIIRLYYSNSSAWGLIERDAL